MHTLTRIIKVGATAIVALLLVTTPLHAQTALTTTTLGAAVTDPAARSLVVASATGITAPVSNQTQSYLLIDRELIAVRGVAGTTLSVARGQNVTRPSTHASGAAVTVVPQVAIYGYVPAGSCTRTALPYVPVVLAGGSPLGGDEVGVMFDCVGSVWVSTSAPIAPPVVGSTVASAATIAPTGTYFKVSGTTTINTITLPAGWAAGMCLQLEPTGLWSTGTSGNILLATTGVVSKVLTECWNGTKWAPSY